MIEAQPMPSIDYDNYIVERCAQLAGRLDTEPGTEREAAATANLLEGMRDRLAHWTAIGNLYADVLESPATAPALRQAIHAELEALEEAAGSIVATTSPALVRMLYPLMRDLAAQREEAAP